MKHFYHYCGAQGHKRPNCFKIQALKRTDSLRGLENLKRMPKGNQAKGKIDDQRNGDVMEIESSGAKTQELV